jgi:hypothetical protein
MFSCKGHLKSKVFFHAFSVIKLFEFVVINFNTNS